MKYVSLITNCKGRENAISIEHPDFQHIVIFFFFLIFSWRGCVKYIYEGCSEREGAYCILNYERKISLSSGRRNRAHLKFDRSRWKKHFQGKQQQEIIKILWESDQHKKKKKKNCLELFVKDFSISFIFWFFLFDRWPKFDKTLYLSTKKKIDFFFISFISIKLISIQIKFHL